ncbi:MAG: hypothetical protein CL685_03415 [Candidatus Magasanikbacteria bacterium]|nr:hypothetical protein [Candidatus Magasanikbacteria bacterium]
MRIESRLRQIVLVLGDLSSYVIGFWLALAIRHFTIPNLDTIIRHVPLFGFMMGTWLVVNYINGLYDLTKITDKKILYRRILETSIIALLVGVVFFYIIPNQAITPKRILVLTAVFGYSVSTILRVIIFKYIGITKLTVNCMFVGVCKETVELVKKIETQKEKGYIVKAIIDPEKVLDKAEYPGIAIYHSVSAVRPAITNHQINVVIVNTEIQKNEDIMRELYELLFWPVHITQLPVFYESITGRISPSTFSESWFLQHLSDIHKPVYEKLRVIVDYVAAIIIGAIFLALLLPVSLAIKLTSKGPIFFIQERVGKFGRKFKLYKFRSMYVLGPDGSAEENGYQFAKKNDVRITSIGRLLRKTRIDELPQVINLWKHDVTLIGPRPERPQIVEELTRRMSYYPLRHVVRPGLTGWAVLHQHYADSHEKSLKKLQFDLFYIKNKSFLLDISIILKTVNIIFRGLGQ